jgi:hypothetical protein
MRKGLIPDSRDGRDAGRRRSRGCSTDLDSLISPTLVYDASGAVALISLGLTISARVRSEELADGLLNPLSWPMMILSGV